MLTEEQKKRLVELKEKAELTAEEKTELEGLEKEPTTEEKKFTQEQVNGMIKKESAKAVEKLLKDLGVDSFENAKDGIAKLKEIEDSKKTDLEKLQEQVKLLTEQQQEKDSIVSQKEIQIALLGANVPKEKLEQYTKLLSITEGDTMDSKMESVLKDFPLTPTEPNEPPPSIGGQVGQGSEVKTLEQESADLDAVFGLT